MNLSHHLNVFNHVVTKGELRDSKYELGALTAWHDFDGYTCYIGYKDLTMSLFFHSRFSYDFTEEDTYKEFTLFIEKLRVEL